MRVELKRKGAGVTSHGAGVSQWWCCARALKPFLSSCVLRQSGSESLQVAFSETVLKFFFLLFGGCTLCGAAMSPKKFLYSPFLVLTRCVLQSRLIILL